MAFCHPAASILIVLPLIVNDSSKIGIAFISLDFCSTASSANTMLFSLHHALTDCKQADLLLLLPRIAFPSIAICSTFLPLFIISFALSLNKDSIIFGSSIVNNRLNVHSDGIPDF